jgi:hypothetical protein
VHHQSILSNKQRDAALSSRIYYSLRGYSIILLINNHDTSRTLKDIKHTKGYVDFQVDFLQILVVVTRRRRGG